MNLCVKESLFNNPSIILTDSSITIDIKNAHYMKLEDVAKRCNIPITEMDLTYNNWYLIDDTPHYLKERKSLFLLLNELLGEYLSLYMGFDSIRYKIAIEKKKMIGLFSEFFRKDGIEYVFAQYLEPDDHKKISEMLNSKENNQNFNIKRKIFDYLIQIYYMQSTDLCINVLLEKRNGFYHIGPLFDFEESFRNPYDESIDDPYTDTILTPQVLSNLLSTNPLFEESINKILAFNMNTAFDQIEDEHKILINEDIRRVYIEFDKIRKKQITNKIRRIS